MKYKEILVMKYSFIVTCGEDKLFHYLQEKLTKIIHVWTVMYAYQLAKAEEVLKKNLDSLNYLSRAMAGLEPGL